MQGANVIVEEYFNSRPRERPTSALEDTGIKIYISTHDLVRGRLKRLQNTVTTLVFQLTTS